MLLHVSYSGTLLLNTDRLVFPAIAMG